jgi:hypothetical protein
MNDEMNDLCSDFLSSLQSVQQEDEGYNHSRSAICRLQTDLAASADQVGA